MQNAFQNYEAVDVTFAFVGIQLPSLQKLYLWGLIIAPDVLSTFLTSHTELEDIRLVFAATEEADSYRGLLAQITLPAGALPNLKTFRGPDTLRKGKGAARGEATFKNKASERWTHSQWLTTRSVLSSLPFPYAHAPIVIQASRKCLINHAFPNVTILTSPLTTRHCRIRIQDNNVTEASAVLRPSRHLESQPTTPLLLDFDEVHPRLLRMVSQSQGVALFILAPGRLFVS